MWPLLRKMADAAKMADDSPARKKDLSLKRLFREGEIDFDDLELLLVKNARSRVAYYKDNLGKVHGFAH